MTKMEKNEERPETSKPTMLNRRESSEAGDRMDGAAGKEKVAGENSYFSCFLYSF